jgi:hypothetical protein
MKRFNTALLHSLLLVVLTLVPVSLFSSTTTAEEQGNSQVKIETARSGVAVYWGGPRYYGYRGGWGYPRYYYGYYPRYYWGGGWGGGSYYWW